MSFYVIDEGIEGNERRCRMAKIAEIDMDQRDAGVTLNITVDDVRIHLDSVDTLKLKDLLEKIK